MPKAIELPKEVYQREDGRWCKPCPECGEMQDYLRRNYAIESFRLRKACKKCSNRKNENCHRGFYGEIRKSWWDKTSWHAEHRHLDFSITPEYVQSLWEKNNKKCALSGIPIDWQGTNSEITASIDRINSSKGYIEGNVQVVHKHINMMKQAYDNNYFIQLCMAVAEEQG